MLLFQLLLKNATVNFHSSYLHNGNLKCLYFSAKHKSISPPLLIIKITRMYIFSFILCINASCQGGGVKRSHCLLVKAGLCSGALSFCAWWRIGSAFWCAAFMSWQNDDMNGTQSLIFSLLIGINLQLACGNNRAFAPLEPKEDSFVRLERQWEQPLEIRIFF